MYRTARLRALGFTEEDIQKYIGELSEKEPNSPNPCGHDSACEISTVTESQIEPTVQCDGLTPCGLNTRELTPYKSTPITNETEEKEVIINGITEDEWYEYEERAAIMEYDGNLPREEAERESLKLIKAERLYNN